MHKRMNTIRSINLCRVEGDKNSLW